MNKPLVSIIIPCYNHQKFIDSCFKSIIMQTYSEIEVILIDDCSKDKTVEMIEQNMVRLEERFIRVELRKHTENKGITKTLNEGLKIAEGIYIKILASDDMLHPRSIETLVNAMEENRDYDMLFSNGQYISEECSYEEALLLKNKNFYNSNPLPQSDSLVQTLYLGNFIVGGTVFFRNETYKRLGLYDETIPIEDWEYNLRVAVYGIIGYVEAPIFFYRQVTTSISHINKTGAYVQRYEYMYRGSSAVIEKYKEFVGEEIYLKKMINLYEAYIEKAFSVRWIEKMKELKQKMKSVKIWNYRWQVKYFMAQVGLYSAFDFWRKKIKG